MTTHSLRPRHSNPKRSDQVLLVQERAAVTQTERMWPGGDYKDDLIVRQMLAIEAAIQEASKRQFTWLVHIDIDELLFHPDNDNAGMPQDVRPYFAAVPVEIDTVEFSNWEAVPEVLYVNDSFKEVTLFKQPEAQVRDGVIKMHWPFAGRHHQYFLSYDQGKSAVRLGRHPTIPGGSHRFTTATEKQSHLRKLKAEVPQVLHYVNCGFSQWRAKIEVAGPITSRDLTRVRDSFFKASQRACRDEQRAERFYSQVIMFSDQKQIESLIKHGIMQRITGPQLLLAAG